MDRIIVGVAEGKVARENQVFTSYALGSCVGACLYDRRGRIIGMVHVILPERKYLTHQDDVYKFADEGVHELISQMGEQGARSVGLIAKIAGGARMFGALSGMLDVEQQNVVAVRECLAQEGTRLIAQHISQSYGRIILFYAENGRLEVNAIRRSAIIS